MRWCWPETTPAPVEVGWGIYIYTGSYILSAPTQAAADTSFAGARSGGCSEVRRLNGYTRVYVYIYIYIRLVERSVWLSPPYIGPCPLPLHSGLPRIGGHAIQGTLAPTCPCIFIPAALLYPQRCALLAMAGVSMLLEEVATLKSKVCRGTLIEDRSRVETRVSDAQKRKLT